MTVAAVCEEWERTRGGGRKDERDDERVAETGVRLWEEEGEERGGDGDADELGSDRDSSEEDDWDGDGDGRAAASAAAV